jgi:hypothetical protein
MVRTHVLPGWLRLAGSFALFCGLRTPQAFAQAQAQAPAPAPAAVPEPPVAGGSEPAPAPADVAKPAEASPALDPAALNAKLDKLQQAFDELKAQQDAAAAATAASAASPADDSADDGEALKIYGFMDMGVQHLWANENSLLTRIFQVNNTSFVVGNVNLYFDAQPFKHFRGLTELRFTNAPLGDIANYGGLAGTFQRKDTFSYDPGGTAINAPMWAGSVILERAWIEWNEHQAFKLRVGNFFTPFGIWNADHGTPTLISLALPQFIVQRWMPIRQTGVMAYGSHFAGDWELGYVGTLSNGRQEISNYNFNNSFGVGGRVFARREAGQVNTTFGLSYFTGRTRENEVDFVASPTGINGVTAVDKTRWAYTEHVAGADVSVDIDATRIRAEGVVRRMVFDHGQHAAGDPLYAPGSFAPNSWQESAYLLVANQLPWGGIEPYVFGEFQEEPTIVGDCILIASIGVNIHFNSALQLKTQATKFYVKDWLLNSPYDASINNLSAVYSRLVMAF